MAEKAAQSNPGGLQSAAMNSVRRSPASLLPGPEAFEFGSEQMQLRHELNASPRVQSLMATREVIDASPQVTAQLRLRDELHGESVPPAHPKTKPPAPNRTGLPDQLKAGVENLSGHSMDDVRVHYNSARPAQLQAFAYAQGTDIHVAPGQEKHLPHEAWHVAQQKQGRVRPTIQRKPGIAVNDDAGLEREADVMGARANSSGRVSSSVPLIQRAMPPGPPVAQGVWLMTGLEDEQKEAVSKAALENPYHAFILWLRLAGKALELDYLKTNDGLIGQIIGQINETFFDTFQEKGIFTFRYLMGIVEGNLEVLGTLTGGTVAEDVETDDSDHPEGEDAKLELIDWTELTPTGLSELEDKKDEFGQPVLFNIFMNLVNYHYQKAGANPGVDLVQAFKTWYSSGVKTRAKFKELIGLNPVHGDNQNEIIQPKRTGNSFAHSARYDGRSVKFEFQNVIYYRDSDGNIDFTKDPRKLVSSYNAATKQKLKQSDIKWTDPQDGKSKVQMQNHLKNKRKGVMPSGKEVEIAKASRGQHFAIADMLYPNKRGGAWTWHHLTDEYKMVLVDMEAHRKHGHNGGVFIWK